MDMKSYRKIIEEERAKLEQNVSWWPLYFYHFTDVYNAVSIIKSEYIYSRHTADKEKLMSSDNASPNVINITDKKVTEYARLYMRPKTPTQYHNEGHKPEHIRNQDLNANCPIPIFFFLDAEKMLSMDGVKIVEKGLAGHSLDREFISGPEAYSSLNFIMVLICRGVILHSINILKLCAKEEFLSPISLEVSYAEVLLKNKHYYIY